jgi:membrane dipeptidase
MEPLIFDAHQDLAWNMLTFGRDYSLSAHETRLREQGSLAEQVNDQCTLGWPEYQRGRVAVVFATLFAAPARLREGDWDTQTYQTPDQAHAIYSAQLDAYDRLFDQHPGKFVPLRSTRDLSAVIEAWNQAHAVPAPTGLLTLMEGAEGVRNVDELDEWWQRGVRIIGPAWKSTRFCGGTGEPGPLTAEGRALLAGMAERGFCLDLSHMAWEAALEALDRYEGPVLASHANPLKAVRNASSNRFLSDEILDRLLERDAVIGVVPFNRFLVGGWKPQDGRQACPLDLLVAQIDYICQRAGDAHHAGLGSDFDGGFGLQQIPAELDTVADLQKIVPLLAARGYSEADIRAVLGMNWYNYLQKGLPA